MGIETGLIIGAAVSAAGVVAQSIQASKASSARKEARAIQGASEEIQNRLARRKAAREERIRRARITQGAENAGASESSGLVGAISALGSNFGSAVAGQESKQIAAQGVSRQSQNVANASSRSQRVGSFVKITKAAIDLGEELDLFGD